MEQKVCQYDIKNWMLAEIYQNIDWKYLDLKDTQKSKRTSNCTLDGVASPQTEDGLIAQPQSEKASLHFKEELN